MSTLKIAVIPGDGIGKEVVPEGIRVLEDQSRAAVGQGAALARDGGAVDFGAPEKWIVPIAANVVALNYKLGEDGYTDEELKLRDESRKILEIPGLPVSGTCVRVPVFTGHSLSINVEFERPLSAEEATQILRSAPGILVDDKREPGGYITPHEAAGEDATYISRIREDITVENGLSFWCVSDNLRKGAALNTVQIAEVLVNRKLIQPKQKAA